MFFFSFQNKKALHKWKEIQASMTRVWGGGGGTQSTALFSIFHFAISYVILPLLLCNAHVKVFVNNASVVLKASKLSVHLHIMHAEFHNRISAVVS